MGNGQLVQRFAPTHADYGETNDVLVLLAYPNMDPVVFDRPELLVTFGAPPLTGIFHANSPSVSVPILIRGDEREVGDRL
jgi:hypothetical protein